MNEIDDMPDEDSEATGSCDICGCDLFGIEQFEVGMCPECEWAVEDAKEAEE